MNILLFTIGAFSLKDIIKIIIDTSILDSLIDNFTLLTKTSLISLK